MAYFGKHKRVRPHLMEFELQNKYLNKPKALAISTLSEVQLAPKVCTMLLPMLASLWPCPHQLQSLYI